MAVAPLPPPAAGGPDQPRRALWGGAFGAGAIVCAALFWAPRPPAPPTAPGSTRLAVTATPVPAPPVVTSTPDPETVKRRPLPTPRLLPASNAFTTLDDYRRRQASMPRKPEPKTIQPAGRTPETEIGRVSFLVRDYRAAFGENPVGSNKEITRALLGNNPKGTKFVDPSTVTLDDQGQMLDAWGRPYSFHAISGTVMEIRSAGPDGKIYTADDLVR